ncbi:transmembrane protein 30C [Mastacembelus armatus]|uniref:Transmembrane protein 30C n=1 Tax=Mastacembelus armatus TaxID=205130 RepID=A0A3Q3MKF7_9TELE|nr:cell cycle control protein 50C-like [Mastacembelus armatus]XP_026151326.1 cell cycle control protein 50C-like [Mastacembelus armatus]XP_026151328.1 cell cycle control protein 50C-like [Mastacembelus armatus]
MKVTRSLSKGLWLISNRPQWSPTPARPAGKVCWQAVVQVYVCVRTCRDIAEKKNRKRRYWGLLVRTFWLFTCTASSSSLPSKRSFMGRVKGKSGPLARRPDNSAFKQQRLPAWSPMLTANTVLPFFYFMALTCMLLGVWLLLTVQSTQEIRMDYTEAGTCNICFEKRKNVSNAAESCSCKVVFPIEKPLKGDVFFYYSLQNFHQNLRRYMSSRDDGQLVGRKNHLTHPSSYCEPFTKDQNGLPVAPCGAVANSIFNDSFTLTYYGSSGLPVKVPLLRNGITWYTDKNVKFRNPKIDNWTLPQVFEGTAKPLYWQKPVYELDPLNLNNNGFINDDLIIWMRAAAFPNFKKLYGVLYRAKEPFTTGLPVGNYSITISYNFPVQYFQGKKEVVLTTLTWFGGQNHFLPIAYLVTSSLVLLIAVILTVVWWKFGKNGKNMEE